MSAATPPPPDDASDPLVLADATLLGTDAPTSVLIGGGRVLAVGPDAEVAHAPRVPLEGRTVMPGLWDRHAHVAQWAVARRRIDVRAADGPHEAAAIIAAAAASTDPSQPLVAWGFRYGAWHEEPHRDLLEQALPGRAVLVTSIDLHTAWLSPAGLRRVGAGEHPTGVLRERDCYRAMGAYERFDGADVDRIVRDGLAAAAARGVTGIVDFEFGDVLPDWQRRAAAGPLPVRIVTTVYPDALDAAIARSMPTGTDVPGGAGRLTVGPLKVFVDGSLGSGTALCHHPYPSADGVGVGRLETPPDELAALLRRASAHGFEVAVHAIGDRAVGVAIDALVATGVRGRLEHAQLVAAADVPRLARPGLTVGVQPAHLLDDRDVADRVWAGRTDRAFPLAELLAADVRVEFGSDAPVAPLDPWLAVAAAVTRTGDDREPWHAEHRISATAALRCSTAGRWGIRAGDPADLVVLDRDPTTLSGRDLLDPGVAATMCAGRWTAGTFEGARTP